MAVIALRFTDANDRKQHGQKTDITRRHAEARI
jgi:hypothetical protein